MQGHIAKLKALFLSKRFMQFLAVGLTNTAVDYLILNVCVSFFGFPEVIANTISSTTALCLSFLLNRKIVFKDRFSGKLGSTAILFFTCSFFNIWVIQNGTLYLVHRALLHTNLHSLSNSLLINISKLVATCFSLLANYLSYHYIVFRHKRVEPEALL